MVLGADHNSNLIDLDIGTVGASVPFGFRLEIKIPPPLDFCDKPFQFKKYLLNAATVLDSECLFQLQRAISCVQLDIQFQKVAISKETIPKWT